MDCASGFAGCSQSGVGASDRDRPDVDGSLTNTDGYGGVVDATDEVVVTVSVGGWTRDLVHARCHSGRRRARARVIELSGITMYETEQFEKVQKLLQKEVEDE